MNLHTFLLRQINEIIIVKNFQNDIIYQNKPFYPKEECDIKNNIWYIKNEKQYFKESHLSIKYQEESLDIYLYENITEQKKLEVIAYIDHLTNVYSRMGFFHHYEKEPYPFSYILMIDVDHFKMLNDQYGHNMGDKVLQIIATELYENKCSKDMVCRFGGDEFLILSEIKDCEQLKKWIDERKKEIAVKTKELLGSEVTFTVGFAPYQLNQNIDDLIDWADKNMYEKKQICKKQNRLD